MENIENEEKNVLDKINTSNEPPSTKPKKKKKKIKKPKEKKCNGLKELLEQINQEKLEKIKKAQEKKEKEKKIVKVESEIQASTNIAQNENEEKNKDLLKDYINIVNISPSGTTVASHDDFNESQKTNFDKNSENSNKIKNLEISEDDKIEEEQQFYNKRKISSPICDYYDGYDKFLSEIHKGSINMNNSMNFIKKEDFIPFGSCYINNNITNINNINNDSNNYINQEVINNNNNNTNNNNNNNNNEQNDNSNNINDEKVNNNIDKNYIDKNNIDNNYINKNDELEQIVLDKNNMNNINIFNEEYEYINDYMNIPYSQLMDYCYNQIPDINLISKFTLLNDFNIKNKSKSFYKYNNKKFKKNKTNHFNKKDKLMSMRRGDWQCSFCFNLNFSFRNYCNRCKAPKQ